MRTIARRFIDFTLSSIQRARYLFDAPYYDGSGMLAVQMAFEALYCGCEDIDNCDQE